MSEEDIDLAPAESISAFDYGERQKELAVSIMRQLQDDVLRRRNQIIAGENTHSYRHGREWSLARSPEAKEFSQLQVVSAEMAVLYQDIVDHRVHSALGQLKSAAESFERQFVEGLFKLVDDTTSKTGNVIKVSSDPANDTLEMLKKVQFGCDRYGRPTMPSLHTSSQNADRLQRAFDAQPIEFWNEFEQIKFEKEQSALAEEVTRISKFRRS